MGLKAVYFDFGFVIGYPRPDIERKYFYLDWDGIPNLAKDSEIEKLLLPVIGEKEIEEFFKREIYDVFVQHEESNLTDPQSNKLLLKKLNLILNRPVTQEIVDRILYHINTMKYIEIYKDVDKILAALKEKGLRLSIISNMMLPGKLLMEKLAENDLLRYFDTVAISSDIGYIKPHVGIFSETLQKDDLKPEEVIFVGDTYKQDILGAKNAGLKTVWLNFRNEPKELAAFDPPDYEIMDLSEILDLVDRLKKVKRGY